jgi:N-acetylmuramoyl-L-alanine amidase
MRVALEIGHSTRDGGAVRVTDGVQEYEWNKDLAHRIHDLDPTMFEIFHRRPDLRYTSAIRELYGRIDAWGCDLSISMHFNAFHKSSASYTSTLSSGSKVSLKAADAVQSAMVSVMGLHDAGVKVRNRRTGGRGWEMLSFGRSPAILIEPYFGSNPSDCRRADERKQALAEAIYRAVRSVA